MVIIGAGECGTRAALTLREDGYAGPITLVGAETGDPYERPPLSKPDPDAPPRRVTVATAARLADLHIDFRPGRTADRIDRTARAVHLGDGTVIAFEKLLLATGARPRRLSIPGEHHATTFRDVDDARRLFAGPSRRVTLVGAGLIGLELAAALRLRGHSVTVLEASDRALGRSVLPDLAAHIVARHRQAGVDLRFGAAVSAIEADAVILGDGTRVPSDTHVVAIGVVPETALAEAAGLAIQNGIIVDATLRTADPDIYAARDCAVADHPLYGRHLRIETWRNAQDQGIAAARNMLGAAAPFTRVPWFWSDHFDLGLQVAGLPDEGTLTITRETGPDAAILFSLAPDGRLVAASGLGPGNAVAGDVRLSEMLIERGASPDAASLADPGIGLKSLLRTAGS